MTTPIKASVAGFIGAITSWRWLLLALGLILAWHALRGMPWASAWTLLAGIGPFAFLVLLTLNLLLLPLMTARWWQLLQTLGAPIGLFALSLYRCCANTVSFLTPGPHFGGEPLSVFLLHKRQGVPLPLATTSVALDRILEFLASMVVLSCSLLFLTTTALSPFSSGWALPLAFGLLAAVTALLTALFTGRRPLSRLVSRLTRFANRWISSPPSSTKTLQEAITQSEAMAESLVHRHCGQFLAANLFSLVHWLGVLAEFWLMSAFMGHPLSIGQLMAVVITARLAFFTPLPAGLGVLESALPWLTEALGQGSALGLSLCLIIRFRDLLFSLAGLGLTMKYLTCPDKALSIFKNAG